MPVKESILDEVGGFERHMHHTLSPDQKTIQITTISFVNGQEAEMKT
jgi:hypothetical protein